MLIIVRRLIGENIDAMLGWMIESQGRGDLIASFDGKETPAGDYLVYRML